MNQLFAVYRKRSDYSRTGGLAIFSYSIHGAVSAAVYLLGGEEREYEAEPISIATLAMQERMMNSTGRFT